MLTDAKGWNKQFPSALGLQGDLVVDPALCAAVNKAVLAAGVHAKNMKIIIERGQIRRLALPCP